MINVTILEDDETQAKLTSSLLNKFDADFEIKIYREVDELDYANPSDIYLLDIELAEDNNGFDVARKLRENFGDLPYIIFITAHDKYMLGAFDLGAFNYILKPVDKDRFFKVMKEAVSRIENRANTGKRMLTIKSKGVMQTIDPQTVCYLESANHKIVLYTTERVFSCYGKITDWEKRLGDGFFRIHRGYLVNLEYVDSYDSCELRLKNGSKIYISKNKLKAFKAAHLKYLRKRL